MALNSCCGCISLKVGSLIIGIISLIGCVCMFIPFFNLPAKLKTIDNLDVEQITKDLIYSVVNGVVAFFITYSIVITILVVVFIIGVVKAKSEFIAPYLWVGFTNSLFIVPIGIGIMTMASSVPTGFGSSMWIYFCQYLFASLLNIYFLMVVYYYYQETRRINNQEVFHSRDRA